jgi:hypothetical protein
VTPCGPRVRLRSLILSGPRAGPGLRPFGPLRIPEEADHRFRSKPKASRYEPQINPTYAELARHYEVVVIPARPRRPRDKAKVERGVLLAERWILAVLRRGGTTTESASSEGAASRLPAMKAVPVRPWPPSVAALGNTRESATGT